MCAPEIRTHLESYDYWVECRPCDFKSEEFASLEDAAVAFAEHETQSECAGMGCSAFTACSPACEAEYRESR